MDTLAIVTLVFALIYLVYRILIYSRLLIHHRRYLEAVQRSNQANATVTRALIPPRGSLGIRPTTYGALTANLIGPATISFFGDSLLDRNLTYEEIIHLQDQMGNVSNGLTMEQIQNLPSHVYEGDSRDSDVEDGEKKQVCPVCLEHFKKGDTIRILPCLDRFHAGACVDKWLLLHRTCPVCRFHIS